MKKVIQFSVWIFISTVLGLLQPFFVYALGSDAGDWPQEIIVKGGKVVMYQPQPEKLDGNRLESRAAIAIKIDNSDDVIFGAVWFDTRLETDRDERMATIGDVKVKDVRFPDKEQKNVEKLKELLEREMPKWDLQIDLDRLVATIDLAEKREVAAQRINTTPPGIIVVSKPAVLITIDGEPRLRKIENSEFMRVVNTPFTILLSLLENKYYLYADKDTWYTAQDIKDKWEITKEVPPDVAAMAPKPGDPAQKKTFIQDQETIKSGPPPVIYITTEPTELISIDGEPEYTPISKTNLLYMSNTDSDVLLHIKDRHYYVLLSGRWFKSASLKGTWKYVAGKDLPADFARIPEGSHMGTVLYAVPGTDVAKEAVLDAHIPQTAAVDPNKASLTVEFDGKPKFDQINGTNLYYGVNTAIPIIWTGQSYYACDQGIWFVAPSPKGPWKVATSVPEEIYTIPPDSPVYNVTFVRVYEARPEVVYVGYTPGYMNTYVYQDTIVYGTGYYWPGWYGDYYYPRPSTWGYHVRWDPWYGWGAGVSYSTSPFHFSIGTGGWYRGGWWGPSYYSSYRHGYYRGYRRGVRGGYYGRGVNVYRGQKNKARVIAIPQKPGTRPLVSRGVERTRPNNVYVDRRGNVHRRTNNGWQTRTNDRWLQQKVEQGRPLQYTPGTRPIKRKDVHIKRHAGPTLRPPPGTRSPQGGLSPRPMQGQRPQKVDGRWSTQQMDAYQLNRSHNARQLGARRAKSFSGSHRSSGNFSQGRMDGGRHR